MCDYKSGCSLPSNDFLSLIKHAKINNVDKNRFGVCIYVDDVIYENTSRSLYNTD